MNVTSTSGLEASSDAERGDLRMPLYYPALLFVSGAAALVFQVLWVKQLSTVVGVEVHAVTIGISAFFAGLALGSVAFGRVADRSTRALWLLATLELAIATSGVLSTLWLASSAEAFVQLRAAVGPLAWLLPCGLVGLPAFFMGGTLPVMLRISDPESGAVSGSSGRLYAANTAGAIAGTLLSAFLLIPLLGVFAAGVTAASANLVVALSAAVLAIRSGASVRPSSAAAAAPITQRPGGLTGDARLAVWLYAIAGGVALGYEVVWSQAIVQFLSTRAYAFTVMLATYLAGLVIGAWIHARFADRAARPWATFGLLIALAGVCAVAQFSLLGPWLPDLQSIVASEIFDLTDSHLAKMCARFAVASAVLILPTTVLLGAAFPAAVRLVARERRVGSDVGVVAGLNIAGGIAGALLTGFVLVPALGLIRTLGVLAVIAAIVGGGAVLRDRADASSRAVSAGWARRAAAGGLLCAAILLATLTPADKLGRLLAAERGGTLVFYEESAEGTVAVLEQRSRSGHEFNRLYIQGVSNTGDTLPSRRYMRLQALVPLLIHSGEPRSALVIGFGTGITAGALLTYPLERRVAVELVPAVLDAAPHFDGNLDAASDPRLHVDIRDGRHHLLAHSERYDVITLEPPPPSAAGVVNLYSSEFYALAKARLAPGGLLAQWWPLPTQNDEDSRSMVRSLLDVFPHVTLWSTEFHEMLVIGSMQPIAIDPVSVAKRFALPRVRSALAEVGVASVSELLATFVMAREGLTRYAGDAPPVTDDQPRIEYAAWVRPNEVNRVLPRLMALAEPLPVTHIESWLHAQVRLERAELFDFYRAILAAYARDRATWSVNLRRVMSRDQHNPYYRWLVGGD